MAKRQLPVEYEPTYDFDDSNRFEIGEHVVVQVNDDKVHGIVVAGIGHFSFGVRFSDGSFKGLKPELLGKEVRSDLF